MNAVIYHIITTIRRRGVKKGDHTMVVFFMGNNSLVTIGELGLGEI